MRGMLWNCLFPVQFPEFWDTGRQAEMDALLGCMETGENERQKPLQSGIAGDPKGLFSFHFTAK
jgi:hypothetical protein